MVKTRAPCGTCHLCSYMKPLAIALFHPQLLIVAAELINRTIDDTHGDKLTGFEVQYSPVNRPDDASALVWNNVQQCGGCAITPNSSMAMDSTWTGATYDSTLRNVTAELAFHGSAIYIYLIVSNYPRRTGLVSDVICDFRMDGEIVGGYYHPTDGTYRFEYNVLAYSNASFNDDNHTFLIETTGTQLSYVIFDYALYTHSEVSVSSSTTQNPGTTASVSFETSCSSVYVTSSIPSSPGKAMIAGVTVGVSSLIILVVSLILYIRERRRRVNQSATLEKETHFPCSEAPLTRTNRHPVPVPVPGISHDGNSHYRESFPAHVIATPQSKHLEGEESHREYTLTNAVGDVERRTSIIHNRDSVVEELNPSRRADFSVSTANSRNFSKSEWFY
ncbi:hypothetical protein IW261DRAFT_1513858 [Armillaria novae-zelandiae]|uniref:Uncharacterized protein n=1 Tax=Armillaria novae-zelandiae TaxID=153914 RepID=A0AA39NSD3_9AGAR|nr:hypothetical protein IW261DRAFT_1513858 [Armillaria novae-zelandiae]